MPVKIWMADTNLGPQLFFMTIPEEKPETAVSSFEESVLLDRPQTSVAELQQPPRLLPLPAKETVRPNTCQCGGYIWRYGGPKKRGHHAFPKRCDAEAVARAKGDHKKANRLRRARMDRIYEAVSINPEQREGWDREMIRQVREMHPGRIGHDMVFGGDIVLHCDISHIHNPPPSEWDEFLPAWKSSPPYGEW